MDFKSLRNTSFIEKLCFLGEEQSAGRAGPVDVCLLPHSTEKGGVVRFLSARLACCDLPLPWPEFRCAELCKSHLYF